MSKIAIPVLCVETLIGCQITHVGHAADMREFVFKHPTAEPEGCDAEWFLHVQCPWRLESSDEIVTGLFDWHEPVDAMKEMGIEWDPTKGGSLQEKKLREFLGDSHAVGHSIENRRDDLVITAVHTTQLGDVDISLTVGFKLRLFPCGARGEFWRLFINEESKPHSVCAAIED